MSKKPPCELCEKNPASVHYTEIADSQVSKLFICRACAEARGLLEEPGDVEALLSSVSQSRAKTASRMPPSCQRCGLQFEEFEERGRLGCPGCYEAFHDDLQRLLQRLHPGTRHKGKRPGAMLGAIPKETRLADLQQQLERAVSAEDYERAASLRDRIRATESESDEAPASPLPPEPMQAAGVRAVADLLHRPSLWLRGEGPDSDVVLSTRVRFARNVATWNFPQRSAASEQSRALREILQRAEGLNLPAGELRLELEGLPAMERRILGERHLLSLEGVEAPAHRAVVIAGDESVSFMVNEEDHLRIQALRSGLDLHGALRAGDRLESNLGERLEFAFNDTYGYLTACPTNVGTGLRASVLLHLPGLVLDGQMEAELLGLQSRGVTVRGFQGEGSKAMGNLFQVSNGTTLGASEAEILTRLEGVILELVGKEQAAREALLSRARTLLEDRIWRSFGVLRHARKLTAQETLQHGSMLRLGCRMRILELPRDVLDEILTLGQEAHTEFLAGGNGEAAQRSAWRATTIRQRLEGSQN